ncbi:MAG TPA: hypothetical protein VN515_02540 [Terriglobales bacterium]|nr:hypothetical protein [Terriglobales bacterium]
MPKRLHSSLILVAVFVLGIVGGIAGMVWAWPGLHARFFPHHHLTLAQALKPVGLTAAQMPQVEAIYRETGDRGHQIHLQFVPEYAHICDEFTQTRKQERDAYAPLRQQELDKLRAVMNDTQWQRYQQMRAQQQARNPPRQPDVCRHLYPQSKPASPPPAAH